MNFIKNIREGNIFLISPYLPIQREKEDIINYGKYKFHEEDNYIFGRIIEHHDGGGDLIEVFSYFGEIPENPITITSSGRLFEPIHISLAFTKKRYPFIFQNEKYDKYKDSGYKNISFLLMNKLWKGGEQTELNDLEYAKLQHRGVPEWIVYTPTQIEEKIRIILRDRGIELNYDKVIEQREGEFPEPRKGNNSFK